MSQAIDMTKTIEPKSDQLNADDLLDTTKDITVTDIKLHSSPDQPVSIHYLGDDGRPYKPCKSMRRVLVAAWGKDGGKWIGRSMRLYADPEVTFGKQKVGGIRISHLTDIDGPKSYMLTVTRARRAEYRVEPMDTPKRAELSQQVFDEKMTSIKALIEEGKLTPEQAITNLQKHYGEPTAEQRKTIRALKGEPS